MQPLANVYIFECYTVLQSAAVICCCNIKLHAIYIDDIHTVVHLTRSLCVSFVEMVRHVIILAFVLREVHKICVLLQYAYIQ